MTDFYFVKKSIEDNKLSILEEFKDEIYVQILSPINSKFDYVLTRVETLEDYEITHKDMVKVSEKFHIQLYSAMNYHPALGLANMDIFYQIEKNNVFSLTQIESYYTLYLSMHLGAQKEFPFFLATSNKNDNNYYWIMGYNKEKNILKWLNDDFIVTDAKLSDFFIEKELLEKLEGYPEKALYS